MRRLFTAAIFLALFAAGWDEPWPEMRIERRNAIAYRMALVWDTTAADHLTVPAERNKGELFTPVLFWRGSWLVGGVAPLYYRTGLYDAAKALYPAFAAAYAEEATHD